MAGGGGCMDLDRDTKLALFPSMQVPSGMEVL